MILPSYFAKPPPAAPKMHFIQERCTRILKNADPDRQHVRLWTLRTWDEERNKYLGVYIHSKVLMVDDEWMTVGSANAGNRSMGYDTEMNISVKDPDTVSSLRHRLMSEHARCEIPLDPTAASDFMETIAKANGNALEIFEDSDGEDVAGLGEPLERRLFPYRTDKRGMDFPIPAFLL